jgi:transposase
MSVRHVARWYALSSSTGKLIDWRHLERSLGPIDLAGVRVIGMDEFAIQESLRFRYETEKRRTVSGLGEMHDCG